MTNKLMRTIRVEAEFLIEVEDDRTLDEVETDFKKKYPEVHEAFASAATSTIQEETTNVHQLGMS